MRRSSTAIAAVVAGALLCIVAIAGAAAGWGSSTSTKIANPTTPATSLPTEDVLAFVVRLGNAYNTGDEQFLNARLAIEVIDRYGTATCIAYFHDPKLPGTKIVVSGDASPPSDYTYATDGKETVVHGVTGVPIDVVQGGQSTPQTLHVARETDASGTNYRFFVDCGAPAP